MKEKLFSIGICFLTILLSACSEKSVNSQLQIALWYKGQPFVCNEQTLGGKVWQLDNFAFYMSNAALLNGSDSFPVSFWADEPSLQLIRIDTESCEGQVTLQSAMPVYDAQALSFTLGVPFDLNHQNPVTQPMPLNVPDMFWTWRNGYKFLRLDMHAQGDNWAYHLGSVGCTSASAVRAPSEACAKPNRARFSLNIPKAEDLTLVLHLDRLPTGITANEKNRCVMHGDSEPVCIQLYENLNNSQQSVFTLEAINL
ncbi:MbnP family copper-binding protein [Planctobacterium marinum]|uniref:Copper-binding protein MbnP-like domain-containing protein n=1 Tax=Planctobacterium marinum TaxID=1631968 RepID=A0AA48KPT0_9ALTE|nr:hypothetical protein MACH26_24970 [Planctobacterium marinum]